MVQCFTIRRVKAMDGIKERVAYLRGLADGLTIDESTKEGRLLMAMIDVLEDMADEIDLLGDETQELDEYVNAIDEDLAVVEEDLYEDEDEDDECGCGCGECGEDDGFIEMECPNCHETVYVDEEMLDEEEDEILCPNCNEPLPIEFECDCCGHHDDEE